MQSCLVPGKQAPAVSGVRGSEASPILGLEADVDKRRNIYGDLHKGKACLSFKESLLDEDVSIAYASMSMPAVWGHAASMTRDESSCLPFQRGRINSREQV